MYHDTHPAFLHDPIGGAITYAIKTIGDISCVVLLGVHRCINFVMYRADKNHPSVLHMVSSPTSAYNALYISFCVNKIESVEHIAAAEHFSPQN